LKPRPPSARWAALRKSQRKHSAKIRRLDKDGDFWL
jgi:hypothetical protein